MSKFHHEKNWFYLPSTIRNFMDCKFLKRSQKLATENRRWEWVRFTPFYTLLKTKDWLNLAGETKAERRGGEQGDVTTSSQGMELRSWLKYSPSAPVSLAGSQSRKAADVEDEDSNLQPTIEEVQLYQQQLKILQVASRVSPDGQKVYYTARLPIYTDGKLEYISVHLEENKYLRYTKLLQESVDTHKAEGELVKQASDETWSNKWIASPMAYLLDKRQREEWLGDLAESEREMLQAGLFPRWWINVIVLVRVIILLRSLLEIKQTNSHHAEKRRIE